MEYIVYLSYEDGLPTLWDEPGEGRRKARWVEFDGRITVTEIEEGES